MVLVFRVVLVLLLRGVLARVRLILVLVGPDKPDLENDLRLRHELRVRELAVRKLAVRKLGLGRELSIMRCWKLFLN